MSDIREKIKALPDRYGDESNVFITFGIGQATSEEFDIADLKALVDRLERLEGAAGIGPGDDFDVQSVLNYDT